MEAAPGAVMGSGAFCPADAVLRQKPRAVGWSGSSRVSVLPRGGFTDEGYLRYYASPARCGGKEEEKRVVKRRAKLVKGLAAIRAMGGGLGLGLGLAVEARGGTKEGKMAITEAADVLLAELELLRAQEKEMKRKRKEEKKAAMRGAAMQMKACDESEDSEDEQEEMKRDNKMEEKDPMKAAADRVRDCTGCQDSNHKEMKRKKKEEKAAMKAAGKQMKYCGESEDSSMSSSSESSDSDCEEEVVDMSSLRTIPADAEETATGEVQMEVPTNELNLPIVVGKTEERVKGVDALKCDPECSSSVPSGVDSSTSTCCSSNKSSSPVVMVAEATAPMDRIEVCVGGKCKRSGAMELMEEFERRVGIEGAVVGCKCMGKCKEGPNVRVRSMFSEGDDSVNVVKNPLCIGVGLDDVGAIVANFFTEEKDMGLLAV